MINLNTDIKFDGYAIRYKFKRHFDSFRSKSFMEIFEHARHGSVNTDPDYYFEIYRIIGSESGYYEPVFELKCKYFINI